MKCPLFVANTLVDRRNEFEDWTVCLGDACAWWDKVTARCYFVTISTDLDRIALHLCAMVDKMPPKKEY